MSGPLDVVVRFLGDNTSLDSATDKSGAKLSAFGKSIDVGGVAKVAAFAGAVGIAAGAVIGLTEAAAADRDEQNKLLAVTQAAGAAHGDYAAQLDAAIAAGQDKAFTDSQVREGLASLITATGDVTTATELMNTAQDVARFADVDLATASDAVAKAHAGNAKALQSLIPGLEKGASASDTLAAAQAAAAGQADTFAASSAGQAAMVSDSFSELGETIGSAFLPVLDALLPALVPIIKQLAQLVSAVLPILVPLLKLVASALSVVLTVLSTLVGWVVQLVTWLGKAIDQVGKFLDSVNPLKGLKLPSLPFLSSTGAPMPAGFATSRGLYATAGTGPTSVAVNVYGNDPDAVIRTIVRWAGHNGGSAAFIRRLDTGG